MRRNGSAVRTGLALPFLAAAGLALGLALFAGGLLLTLAAAVIGPLPAARTAFSLSREAARRFNEQFAYAQTHYFAPQGESER